MVGSFMPFVDVTVAMVVVDVGCMMQLNDPFEESDVFKAIALWWALNPFWLDDDKFNGSVIGSFGIGLGFDE